MLGSTETSFWDHWKHVFYMHNSGTNGTYMLHKFNLANHTKYHICMTVRYSHILVKNLLYLHTIKCTQTLASIL